MECAVIDFAVSDVVRAPVVRVDDGRERNDVLLVLAAGREERLEGGSIVLREFRPVRPVAAAVEGNGVRLKDDGVLFADMLVENKHAVYSVDAVGRRAEDDALSLGVRVVFVIQDGCDARELRSDFSREGGAADDDGEGGEEISLDKLLSP